MWGRQWKVERSSFCRCTCPTQTEKGEKKRIKIRMKNGNITEVCV
jgi:hypothetical protein